jgi:hypothetical protein
LKNGSQGPAFSQMHIPHFIIRLRRLNEGKVSRWLTNPRRAFETLLQL